MRKSKWRHLLARSLASTKMLKKKRTMRLYRKLVWNSTKTVKS